MVCSVEEKCPLCAFSFNILVSSNMNILNTTLYTSLIMENYLRSVPTLAKVSRRDLHGISFTSTEKKLTLVALVSKNALNSNICKAEDNGIVISLA